MIILTKLNGEKFMLNPDLIEIVTENPDTVITTSTGHSYIVEQSMNEILSLIKEYRLSVRRQRLERSTEIVNITAVGCAISTLTGGSYFEYYDHHRLGSIIRSGYIRYI